MRVNTISFRYRFLLPVLLFYVLFFLPLKGSTQVVAIIDSSDYIEGTYMYKETFEAMHAIYHKPDNFQLKNTAECFDSIPLFHKALTCQLHPFYSNDSHFIAFLDINKKLTPQQIELSEAINPKLHYDVNTTHICRLPIFSTVKK